MSKVRASNLELLRIISMLLVVCCHCVLYGVGWDKSDYLSVLDFSGGVGVNCFVLTSGYFMVNRKITLAKLLKLWVEVLTYTVILLLIVHYFYPGDCVLGLNAFKFAFLPIVSSTYWFISVYVLLMLLSPFLNRFLHSLDRASLFRFLAVLAFTVEILPSFFQASDYGKQLAHFVFLYCIAGCIRLHVKLGSMRAYAWFMGFVGLLVTREAVRFLDWQMSYSQGIHLPEPVMYLFHSRCFLSAMGLCLFMGFVCCKMGFHRWINLLASCSLAVYLVHEYPPVRQVLWRYILPVEGMGSSPWSVFSCIGIAMLVYLACALIELVRKETLGRLYDWAAPRWGLPLAYSIWGRARHAFERLVGIK